MGKIPIKRDQNGLKRTQKGAKHRQNAAKQPQRTTLTNHERMLLRRAQREAKGQSSKNYKAWSKSGARATA